MKALSSMRRDAEVAPKCLLRSLVTRKKNDSLKRALEAKERRRRNQGKRKRGGGSISGAVQVVRYRGFNGRSALNVIFRGKGGWEVWS